jgi:methionyl-tRNA synthetase
MPYGNKSLHFGHIGGVFVPADCYARFLRMRIPDGYHNVVFVSGTDCYGSPIAEAYRKLSESGRFQGSEADYVRANHRDQAAALRAYEVSLDAFEGSGLGACKDVHAELTSRLIQALYAGGYLELVETEQFYDEEAQTFLNGRQVQGHCPVQGCKSEKAYADECDLGHQYLPAELIAPVSTVSGTTPSMRKVANWYFKLPEFMGFLRTYVGTLEDDGATRKLVFETMREFLTPPILFVQERYLEDYQAVAASLPAHGFKAPEKGKSSFELEFKDFASRDLARATLSAAGIKMRSGKTLVPLRLTGNIAWGVPAPELDGVGGLTVWVWPESLWAPISFTTARLAHPDTVESLNPAARLDGSAADYWNSPDSQVYQFIGQDNIYFYGIAQTALWQALASAADERLHFRQSRLIANYHLLFLDKKASSSGAVKPPMAAELLDLYTADELRSHFLALGLEQKPVSFQPKPLNPAAQDSDADPVLKEGTFLANVFNRVARSCFYEVQNNFGGAIPAAAVSTPARRLVADVCDRYDQAMYAVELHSAQSAAMEFIRSANKYWSAGIKQAGEDLGQRGQVLADSFYLLKAAVILMQPFVPEGCGRIFEQLDCGLDFERFFSWSELEADDLAGVRPRPLPPHSDFFARH